MHVKRQGIYDSGVKTHKKDHGELDRLKRDQPDEAGLHPNEKLTGEMKIHMGESDSKIKTMDQSTLPSMQRELAKATKSRATNR